jgi:hypothetical protein
MQETVTEICFRNNMLHHAITHPQTNYYADRASNHIRHPSLILECISLTATRIFLPPDAPGLPTPIPLGDVHPGEDGRDGCEAETETNTSTIHSYQTLRLSVWRHIVTAISALSGMYSGAYIGFIYLAMRLE